MGRKQMHVDHVMTCRAAGGGEVWFMVAPEATDGADGTDGTDGVEPAQQFFRVTVE